MRPNNTKIRWIAAASCLLAISSVVTADEGVARISDANQQAGIARIPTSMGDQLTPAQLEQRAAYARIRAQLSGSNGGPFQQVGYRSQMPPMYQPQNLQMMQQTSYTAGGCGTGHCGATYSDYCDSSCPTGNCSTCQTGHCGCNQGKNRRNRKGNNCQSCDSCYGDGYNQRMCTLFAKPARTGGTRQKGDWWHAQTSNYQARNQKLANHLFGWLIPSGCGGQGCPPFGKYHVTYADDPGYADPRDGQVYGAQGYGTHLNVPLAPNVRHSYNYSWGTPASRISPVGQYAGPGPATANMHQTW